MHVAAPVNVVSVEAPILLEGRFLTVTGTVSLAADTAYSAVESVRAHDEDGAVVSLDRCGTLAAKEVLFTTAVELWRGGR